MRQKRKRHDRVTDEAAGSLVAVAFGQVHFLLPTQWVFRRVSGMRTRLPVTAIMIVMLTGQLAYGQVRSVKPSGPTGGTRPLTAPTKPAVPPPGDALRNLAGGGYADPNYVAPGTHSEKATRHRVVRTHRTRWAGSLFTGYRSYKAFPYRDCNPYCGWNVPVF